MNPEPDLGAIDARHLVMSILAFIILGLIAGFLARALMPGRQSMGLVMTSVLGMAGSFIGGFLASFLSGESLMDFHATGLIGSVIGALALLALLGFTSHRRALI